MIHKTEDQLHAEYVRVLREQRESLKVQYEAIGQELRRLNAAIEALDNLKPQTPVEEPSRILVEANQFRGMRTPQALGVLMRANPQPYKQAELTDALWRGGLDPDKERVRDRTKDTLKLWRRRDRVTHDAAAGTWMLTQVGAAALENESNEPEPQAERSLFVGQG
jgi:hypothetical protein